MGVMREYAAYAATLTAVGLSGEVVRQQNQYLEVLLLGAAAVAAVVGGKLFGQSGAPEMPVPAPSAPQA